MGAIEIVMVLCLQAEPAACRVTREVQAAPLTACIVREGGDGPVPDRNWYVARYSCRWRAG
ncbi:hypothetical protein IHQ68_17175 [Chelatococcus sambhunathii]|uniref:Uncharacterized protein n=1 Tax=Chelatococcus sambhunathii TaxID=363953 RepID=A0ABU1DK01_9HYPH|nr:hypothetical protein [Chelatococcus sambhunathii]MDR4308353.1 hypothetical protein [Chelatococcus sambhunathii]